MPERACESEIKKGKLRKICINCFLFEYSISIFEKLKHVQCCPVLHNCLLSQELLGVGTDTVICICILSAKLLLGYLLMSNSLAHKGSSYITVEEDVPLFANHKKKAASLAPMMHSRPKCPKMFVLCYKWVKIRFF